MKEMRLLAVFFLVCAVLIAPAKSFGEDLKITTYYPAPFGAYDRIKLVPRDSLSESPYCDDDEDLGLMYYDNGKAENPEGVYVCQKNSENDFQWILVSKNIKKDPKPAGNQKVVCVKSDGFFGVCLNNPSADGTCYCQ